MGHSAEYLSAFYEKSKELLSAWMVKAIHDAAKPSSGGKARHRPAVVDNTTATFGAQAKADDLLSALADLLSQLGYDPGSADDLSARIAPTLILPSPPVALDPDSGQPMPPVEDDGVDNMTTSDEDDVEDDDPGDLDIDEDLGDGRLQPADAAAVVLRALWRNYMATHYPPADGDGDFDYRPEDGYGSQEGNRAYLSEFATEKAEGVLGHFDLTAKPGRTYKHQINIWKGDQPQQIVYGVVLVPEQVDSQGDIIGSDEIEQAAHRFLTQYRESGLQHVGDALPSLEVIESYIAPIDMEVAGNPVPKGSWVMAVKINDPEIWQMVLDETLTGFSIQGWANSTEEAA
jgi:hypothetical protein